MQGLIDYLQMHGHKDKKFKKVRKTKVSQLFIPRITLGRVWILLTVITRLNTEDGSKIAI